MTAPTILKRLVPVVYFLLVSLPHHLVSNLIDEYLLVPFGMEAVQSYADLVSIALLLGIVALGVRVILAQRENSWKHLFAGLATIALMYVADRYLIVNNIERIHFLQYAILAILLAWTVHDDVLVFFVSSFAGAVDEFLQFVTNPDHTNYFDFNDIVLNILGAALGVFLVISLDRRKAVQQATYERRIKLVFAYVLASLAFVMIMAMSFGRIVMFLDQPRGHRQVLEVIEGNLSFVLSFQRNDGFWIIADNGKQFHTLSPPEGILLISVILILFRWSMLSLRRPRGAPAASNAEN